MLAFFCEKPLKWRREKEYRLALDAVMTTFDSERAAFDSISVAFDSILAAFDSERTAFNSADVEIDDKLLLFPIATKERNSHSFEKRFSRRGTKSGDAA
ncbi:MAG: hypothetical protein K6B45_00565 [Bacteroidaceae bacterium]|nr:hypothetical protein [Bacteroidaceae bacterium]